MYSCHTYYSLRYGTLSPDEIAATASSLGIDTLILTDINNTYAVFDFVKACRKHGIKPVIGVELRNDNRLLCSVIACNNEGFREINEMITRMNFTPPSPKKKIAAEDDQKLYSPRRDARPSSILPIVGTHGRASLLFTKYQTNQRTNLVPFTFDLSPLKNCYILYPFNTKQPDELKENEFTCIKPSEANCLLSSPYRNRQDKIVVCQPVTFKDDDGYILHKHLRAIDRNTLIANIDPDDLAAKDEKFIPPKETEQIFGKFPGIIENSHRLLSECSFKFDFTSIKNKQTFTGSKNDDMALLTKLAFDGMEYRYGNDNHTARGRIEKELAIINKMGFASYFLITWDIIRYSMSRGFYHVERGQQRGCLLPPHHRC